MNADEDGSAASFFETLLDEAVGPFFVTLDGGTELVVEVPDAGDVADLDTTTSVHDLLDLVAGEDVADVIADAYARRPISDLADLVDDIRAHFGILTPPRYGWAYLVSELDRYGEDIDRELIDHRLNLYDWVRDHTNTPWDKLFRIIERPIDGGWYAAARGSDIELAERILEAESRGEIVAPSRIPSLVGWTTNRELMTALLELLEQILHGTYAASPKFKGKGGRPPKRHPRPKTGRDRAERVRSYRDHDEIASQLLGSRYKPILSDPRG